MKKLLLLVAAVFLFGVVASLAQRPHSLLAHPGANHNGPVPATVTTTVLDPQLFVCGSVCSSAPGGDPNLVTGTNAWVGFHNGKNGGVPLTSDLIIILGVPGTSSAVPTVNGAGPIGSSSFTCQNQGCTNNAYGVTFSNYGGNTAIQLGDPGGGSSEQFQGWTAANLINGSPNPDAGQSSFTLYEFDLGSSTGIASGVPVEFSIGNAPTGTWIIAYGCDGAISTCSGGNVFSTPFTNPGLTTSTPEPASAVLLGTGLLGLVGLIRKRKNG